MLIFLAVFLAVIIVFVFMSVRIVPQQEAWVVERLGSFNAILNSGPSFIVPFLDRVAYKHTLKEIVLDVPEQTCITKDNVQVAVDGVLFIQVIDARKASYGVVDYSFAIIQLAQTTMRSEIGKIPLDKTFEERALINENVVHAVDTAATQWGVKTLRYEIKDIKPPLSVREAMEKQMQAERNKRAAILQSEGEQQAAINVATGRKQKDILESEGEMQKAINIATGQAQAIETVAAATRKALAEVAESLKGEGGVEAAQLRVATQFVDQFGSIARTGNTIIVPANLSDVSGMVAAAMGVIKKTQGGLDRPGGVGAKS